MRKTWKILVLAASLGIIVTTLPPIRHAIAQTAISGWPALSGSLADGDLFIGTDVSDTSSSANGTTKKITASQIDSYVTGKFGANVNSALGVAVGSAGSILVNGGDLGTPSAGNLSSISASNFPTLNQNTTGNAATASALAVNPADCGANSYASAISANGDLACTGLGAALDAAFGSTRGSILFRGASGWSILAPNTAGYVLTDGGVGSDPAWASNSGGSAFSAITTGTNSAATMTVGTGAALTTSGGGTIAATSAPLSGLSGLGANVDTALGVAIGSAGGPMLDGGGAKTSGNFAAFDASGRVIDGGGAVIASGTLTNGELCSYNSTGPAMDCNTSAPTGAIVGTSDAQTLSNKTLASPTITGTSVTFTSGTARTLSSAAEIIVCTSTCTVTTPATPTAGQQFCVQNDDNVSTVITLAAVAGVQYENTARTSYKAANTALASGGAAGDQICMVAISATKWNVFSSNGTWN